MQTQGNIKVEELAEESGFTARHIGKMFERCVGISPKLYSQDHQTAAFYDEDFRGSKHASGRYRYR